MIKELHEKFLKLDFRAKIISIFTVTVFIILLAANVTVYVVMKNNIQLSNQIISKAGQQFESISTNRISEALVQSVLSVGDNAKQLVQQLYLTYQYFCRHRDLVKSFQWPYQNNPPKTTSFPLKKNIPGVYFYSQNSTFHDDPFLDEVLLSSNMGTISLSFIRTNIIYWNASNPFDMMVRTIPATNDFIIHDPIAIANRSIGMQQGFIIRDQNYLDQFTKNRAKAKYLVSLRAILLPPDKPGFKIIFEQQFVDKRYEAATSGIYYVQNTIAVVLIKNVSCPSYCIYGSTEQISFDIQPFAKPGFHKIIIQNGSTILANTVSFSPQRPIGAIETFSYDEQSKYKFIVLLDQSRTNSGYLFMSQFLSNLNYSITVSLLMLSFPILMLVFSLSFKAGNNIKCQFNGIIHLIQDFKRKPQQSKSIVTNLNKITTKSMFGKLKLRLVAIIDRIIQNKDQINRRKILKVRFPLNQNEKTFRQRNKRQNSFIWSKVVGQIGIQSQY